MYALPILGRRIAIRGPLLAAGLLAALLLALSASDQPAEAAIANPGFETGNLSGWTTGATAEGITVVGTDVINAGQGVSQAPLEGNFMARLGNPTPAASPGQEIGPNELVQQFNIDQPDVKFAYAIWTYDYTGYDGFSIDLRLVNSGAVIYSYSQQAWGSGGDTSRKTTGWQIVDIPVGQYQGQQARLTISAGGSRDTYYAFWAYVDSVGIGSEPSQVVDKPGIMVDGHRPSSNPADKTINVTRTPFGGSFRVDIPVACPDGSTPASVTLIVGTNPPTSVPLQPGTVVGGMTYFGGDVPSPLGTRGQTFPMTLVVNCPGQTITILIGSVTLVDPSGFVTDADTGDPIPEATVTLQRLDGGAWVTVNPYELVGGSPTIAPQVNPQLTDGVGHYGWDVIAGSYRVVVVAQGYVTQTSYAVTVPPPVTDLDVALVPEGAPAIAGDVDCSGGVDSLDALQELRFVARLGVAQADGCSQIESVNGGVMFGDVDCSGAVNAMDALTILRFISQILPNLPVCQPF